MSKIILFAVLFSILIVNLTASTQGLQQNIETNEDQNNVNQENQKIYLQDPFGIPPPPYDDSDSKHHKEKNNRHRRKQIEMKGIYEPFSLDDNKQNPWEQHRKIKQKHQQDYEQEDKEDQKQERQNRRFNRMLGWGLLLGSIFLAFVLIKTCVQKRGRRQHRLYRQYIRNTKNIPQAPVINQQPIYHPYPLNESQKIQQQIKAYENQINKLKSAQQEVLKREFNIKKMEEQRKAQMMNLQREQQMQMAQRKQANFGPQYYYAGGQYYNTENSFNQPQQPFIVRGVEPIKRQRSNSFKTELSEMPIIKNEIKYRNGIPIGKPLKNHDNDSSFASEYPEV